MLENCSQNSLNTPQRLHLTAADHHSGSDSAPVSAPPARVTAGAARAVHFQRSTIDQDTKDIALLELSDSPHHSHKTASARNDAPPWEQLLHQMKLVVDKSHESRKASLEIMERMEKRQKESDQRMKELQAATDQRLEKLQAANAQRMKEQNERIEKLLVKLVDSQNQRTHAHQQD